MPNRRCFPQHFAWAYRYRAPPLFTWVLTALGQATSVGAVSIGLIRYGFLGILYGSIYLVARRLLADPQAFRPLRLQLRRHRHVRRIGHRELTHSTALAALPRRRLYAFWPCGLPASRLVPGARRGVRPGAAGEMDFVVFAIALPLACLLSRDAAAGAELEDFSRRRAGRRDCAAHPGRKPEDGPDGRREPACRARRARWAAACCRSSTAPWRLPHGAHLRPAAPADRAHPLRPAVLARSCAAPASVSPPEAGARPLPARPDAALVGMTMAVGLAILWALVLLLRGDGVQGPLFLSGIAGPACLALHGD